MNIFRLYVTVFIIVVIMVVSVLVGSVYGNWQLFCIVVIAICLYMLFYTLITCVDNYLPSRTGKELNHIPGVNVDIYCTRYVLKTHPFFIEFHDVCVAKIYRGNDLVISLPEGTHNIRVYRNPNIKFDSEVTIFEGCKVYLTSNNEIFPEYHILNYVDEQEEIRTYNESLKRVRSTVVESCAIVIPSLISLVWGMFRLGIL